MPDILSLAGAFYENYPSPIPLTVERKNLLKKVEQVISNAVFLSDKKKKNIIKLIPFFADKVLKEMKNTFIRESFRFLIRNKK